MPTQPSLSQSASIRRAERLHRLHALVVETGVVRLNDAARALEVSSMTVRRDLAAEPRTLAYLGGYIVSSGHLPAQARYVLDTEVGTNTQQKIEAGRHAARLVEAGDTLFIDCGSTTPHLIAHLPNGLAVTIVCYSINVAHLAARRGSTQLVMLGGVYYSSSDSFSSPASLAELEQIGISKAFISAGGIEPRGASCSNFHEVAIKRAALASARRSFLVVDASKFGQAKPAFFAGLRQFERIITDKSIGGAVRRRFSRVGPLLDVAG
jgi:DeoR family deoxyribose operon repressor